MISKFVKTIRILLFFALLASTAAAMTENKDLPTQTQIIDFVDSVQDPSVQTLSETSLSENPSWKWDTWKDTNGNNFISFYYTDQDSKKGYGSLYFDNSGNKLSIPCGKYEVVKSYLGEEEKEETVTEEKTVSENEEKEEVIEEEEKEETVKEETEEEDKEEIKEEEKKTVTEDNKSRITKKIASLLIKFNNDKISIKELKDSLDKILEEE